jgi:hypothetical protein
LKNTRIYQSAEVVLLWMAASKIQINSPVEIRLDSSVEI